jgi:glycosyltransferase involved in cell wall biosynthesis
VKVAQINSVYSHGSTGKIVNDLVEVARLAGHSACAFYGRGERLDKVGVHKFGSTMDLVLHGIATRLFDSHGFSSFASTARLICALKSYQPDIVHLHNLHGYYIHVGMLFEFLRHARLPVVWTLHDCWAFTGHCAYYDLVGCKKWTTECGSCPQTDSYPRSLFADRSRKNYQDKRAAFLGLDNLRLVTPSKWLQGEVGRSFLAGYTTSVINNGIDLDVFKQRPSDSRRDYDLGDDFVILAVASVWDERKGLDQLLIFSDELQEDEKMVIVGLPKHLLKGLPKRVIGIQKLSNMEELAGLYSTADVFLNPTLEDNFPTTNLEALACGTPVITYDSGGSSEIIDSDCGLVVKSGDITGLRDGVAKIRTLASGHQLSHSCRNRAEKFYDKWVRFRDYIDLYETVSVTS